MAEKISRYVVACWDGVCNAPKPNTVHLRIGEPQICRNVALQRLYTVRWMTVLVLSQAY